MNATGRVFTVPPCLDDSSGDSQFQGPPVVELSSHWTAYDFAVSVFRGRRASNICGRCVTVAH